MYAVTWDPGIKPTAIKAQRVVQYTVYTSVADPPTYSAVNSDADPGGCSIVHRMNVILLLGSLERLWVRVE